MTLSSAYIELFIRGKSPGRKCPGEMSGYPLGQSIGQNVGREVGPRLKFFLEISAEPRPLANLAMMSTLTIRCQCWRMRWWGRGLATHLHMLRKMKLLTQSKIFSEKNKRLERLLWGWRVDDFFFLTLAYKNDGGGSSPRHLIFQQIAYGRRTHLI